MCFILIKPICNPVLYHLVIICLFNNYFRFVYIKELWYIPTLLLTMEDKIVYIIGAFFNFIGTSSDGYM